MAKNLDNELVAKRMKALSLSTVGCVMALTLALLATAGVAQTAAGGDTTAPDTAAVANPWAGITLLPMDWQLLEYSNDVSVWYRPHIIGPKGGVPRMWERYEYSSAQRSLNIAIPPFRSMASLVEFNCNDASYRVLQNNYFSNNNLDGPSYVETGAPSNWQYPVPGSTPGRFERLVCTAR